LRRTKWRLKNVETLEKTSLLCFTRLDFHAEKGKKHSLDNPPFFFTMMKFESLENV
jgi:hypothetical protein